ncbi:16S rRNA (uracil(1498)-N(3))-methyltransferase [Meiothermus sp. QL-1]|uniref:16S rRNA (uracil(1498)-N(3))-methyltransferase n=1 Tax=Meiothermus sp. QL-1 TaxID=2058095 RepID=UPI000E0BCC43|nr:16S rRNA (uracil(1498)-N(3))-methyltransferase [Meiothermus sp. QL-1]RDI94851.1 16S rRNA (uracil(1498)-N(3))-methyltransferase [Meiothermus sp. QL-1]
MRPHRAYVESLAPELRLTGPEAHHLAEVLRARVGDTLTVFDGQGREGRARVVELGRGWVRLRLEETWTADREPPQPVVLYLPLLKGDHMAEVVRAATELGAGRIVPILTQHCVVRELSENKLLRLRRVAQEAAKQCGRSVVPQVEPLRTLEQVPPVAQGLVAHPYARARVREVYDPTRPVALLTGPEGGLAEAEVALLERRGFAPVALGPRILRAETAPLALLSLVTAGEGF